MPYRFLRPRPIYAFGLAVIFGTTGLLASVTALARATGGSVPHQRQTSPRSTPCRAGALRPNSAQSPRLARSKRSTGVACFPRRAVEKHRLHPLIRHWRKIVHDTGALPKQGKLLGHDVGDPFAVGSYIAQRSDILTPLLVQRVRLLGSSWVREEFTATAVHHGARDPYHWGAYDRVVNAEWRAGIHVLGLLDYSNTFGYPSHNDMPHNDIRRLAGDFSRYAYAAARHFRGRITYWQVWNEPNLDGYWHPTPEPQDYAALLHAAYRAIKLASPHARVVLGGTSGVDLNFINRVAQFTRSFDVVAVHPYQIPPETSLLQQVQALRRFRKPLWFSEIGWPGGDCRLCFSEQVQAAYLVRVYALAAAAGVQRVFWYDLRDDGGSRSNPEGHFGLLHHDLSGKPAFMAFELLAHILRHTRFVAADAAGAEGIFALRFQSRKGPVAVLWNTGGTDRPVTIPWPARTATALLSSGTPDGEATAADGRVTWRVPPTGNPIYLLAQPLVMSPTLPGPVFLPTTPPVLRPAARIAPRKQLVHGRPAARRRPRRTPRAMQRAKPHPGASSAVRATPSTPLPAETEVTQQSTPTTATPTATEAAPTPSPTSRGA